MVGVDDDEQKLSRDKVRAEDAADDASAKRLSLLVDAHADFVWRSLRRLGAPASVTDDATQQVFLIAQQKLASIELGRERGFLFGVAMNVAAHVRRGIARRREVEGDCLGELPDTTPLADAQIDRKRARQLLDRVLDSMSMELRTVFVLFEMEEMTMVEIASVLGCPQGTVASRLRRAREEFHKHAQRLRAEVERRTIVVASTSSSGEAESDFLKTGGVV